MPVALASEPFIIRPEADFLQTHPGLKHLSNQLAHLYASHREVVTEAQLQQVGGQLWAALDVAEAFAAARQQAGRQILPILIESDDPVVQALPWETLHHPDHGFLGQVDGFTLSRCVPAHASRQPDLQAGPLRVLLFTTLPDDLDAEKERLDVEEEQAQVLEALTPWIAEGVVQLEMPDDGRLTTLQAYLRDFQPHLVFMSGHGQYVQPPLSGQSAYGIFLFEDEIGGSQPVAEDKVAAAFLGSHVECVVLSACEAGKGSSEALNNGLAWRLSSLGIPHVVGMRESVLDRAGTLFAHAFCDAVARQEPLPVAVQAGRQAITTPLQGSDLVARHGEQASGLAELSLGQWCLPLLLTAQYNRPLLTWNFTPQPPPTRLTSQTLDTVTLPPRFLGRRAELRALKSRLRARPGAGQLRQLLITGPGGQGKTALAGRLAQDLQRQGYEVIAYAARPENSWRLFFMGDWQLLHPANRADYASMEPHLENEAEKADHLLRLCLRQSGGKVALFFDNLEAVQDGQTQALTDERLAAWMAAAQGLAGAGLILLLTSRWRLPGWPESDHWPLARASYGDFLRLAQEHLPPRWLRERARLRQVYATLHGNGRGLTFFAGAIQGMAFQGTDSQAEEAFLARLAEAETRVQMDMALAEIVAHLPEGALALLHRLPAYLTPVPREGVVKLGLDLPEPEALLQRLLAVSLVEQTVALEWQCTEYQLPPLVAGWLEKQGAPPPDPALLRVAAEYQLYLWRAERFLLGQALAAHAALRRAEEIERADRFALDWIVGPLNRQGLYETLLNEWLPAICHSSNPWIKAEALGQTGKQHHHLGNYNLALPLFQQSLQISQEIGDKSGMGTTLNNMATTAYARGDYDTALRYLEQSLQISQEIGDKSGMGTTLNNMATTAYARGDYDTALRYLEQSLQISQEIGDKSGMGTTLNNMATTAYARGDYDTALRYLEQSLQISQEIGDKSGMGTTLNNMATTAYARGDYDTALRYLEQSLQISQEIGDKSGMGTTLNNMATTAYARGDYDTALRYLEQSLQISQEIGDKKGESTTIGNIANIYLARGDREIALKYFKYDLSICQEIGDVAGLSITLINIGHVHWQNEEQREALSAWIASHQIASQINLAQALQALAELAGQLGLPGGLAGWAALAEKRGD
ncbi:MAG TPA: tetratricopeptide repeat protein [Chloroflexota bacterium]|nr:tetratricopeptide repeat protein [Chloroflexota bacterium]